MPSYALPHLFWNARTAPTGLRLCSTCVLHQRHVVVAQVRHVDVVREQRRRTRQPRHAAGLRKPDQRRERPSSGQQPHRARLPHRVRIDQRHHALPLRRVRRHRRAERRVVAARHGRPHLHQEHTLPGRRLVQQVVERPCPLDRLRPLDVAEHGHRFRHHERVVLRPVCKRLRVRDLVEHAPRQAVSAPVLTFGRVLHPPLHVAADDHLLVVPVRRTCRDRNVVHELRHVNVDQRMPREEHVHLSHRHRRASGRRRRRRRSRCGGRRGRGHRRRRGNGRRRGDDGGCRSDRRHRRGRRGTINTHAVHRLSVHNPTVGVVGGSVVPL
eukprot:Rhum_TRINITY_DN14819_c11_g1::Rhum_TRINITY_DN14819_c11_g1_i1::g.120873::m.120873